jgi:hypothetical protein
MRKTLAVLALLFSSGLVLAQDTASSDEIAAQNAAKEILQLFSDQKFNLIWDTKASEWIHKTQTKDLFLATFSIGRPKLGQLISMTPISRNHFNRDPNVNWSGDGYLITFRTKYTAGEFFEQVGLMKDSDGQYRLTGIDGAPVPPR